MASDMKGTQKHSIPFQSGEVWENSVGQQTPGFELQRTEEGSFIRGHAHGRTSMNNYTDWPYAKKLPEGVCG